MKKILAIVLALALVIIPMTFSVSAEAAATLTVGADKNVEAGEAVAIPVAISGDVVGAQFDIALGDLEYVSCTAEAEDFLYVEKDNTIKYVGANLDGMSNLFTVNVTIPDDAVAETTYTPAVSNVVICGLDEGLIETDVVAGTYTVASSAPIHEHTWEPIAATPATTSAKGSITLKCACGKTEVQDVEYYAYYTCAHSSITYKSELLFNMGAVKAHLENAGAYQEAYIRVDKAYGAGMDNKVTIMNISEATIDGTGEATWSIGIPAKEMTDLISYNVFAKRGGKWYSGQIISKSVQDYATQILGNGSVTPAEKKLVANLLYFGTKMQIFKSYNTDNLADSKLTTEQRALITTTDPSMVNATNNPIDQSKPEVVFSSFALDMGSNISALHGLNTILYNGAVDDLRVVAQCEGKTYVISGEDITNTGANKYSFLFNSLPVRYLRKTYTMHVVNGDDPTPISYTLSTSIESLAKKTIDAGISANEVAVYKAMLNYSDASLAFFGE